MQHITTIFTHLVAKLYKDLRCSFKATADAAVKGKLYSIFSMQEFSAKNFCDGLEMKFASPSDGIQQAGAPETAAKSVGLILVSLSFTDYKRVDKKLYFIMTTSTRS